MTTSTPRRRDRAPLSSVDSNVVGSSKKKNTKTSRTPSGKQQKRFSTKSTKTPGTTKRKKRRQRNDLTIDTPRFESPQFKQQTVCDGDFANLRQAVTVENVVALTATDASSTTTQLSEHATKYTFGSSGILYNSQQWEAEQSTAFKSWLNHLFRPAPEIDTVGDEQRSVELKAAMTLFNSRRMSAIRFAIEREVTEGRLAITPRAGRNILDEVYVQEQLSSLLLSYTPRWLQLGLDVVLAHHGDQQAQKRHDGTKETLKKTILEQVLSKPSAVQKYTAGKVKTASGYFEQMLRVEIQQHTLSVLLILVFFLDEAKTRQLLTEDPCLFEKTSQVKSSQEMLISLCQDCFAKQRSILNHLEYEGISVLHVQQPLDEYDFCVRNFAVDLKDGVCLAKMVDIVTNGCNLLSSLRLPAGSRKHKMYNVRLALAALRQLGVPNISDITPSHIVDAHQPRIIQLVWSTILYFELPEFRQEIIQYKASRLIQGQVRRFLAMKSYHIVLRGCVSLQSLFRGVRPRLRLIEMNIAAGEIQKIWRGYDAKVRYGFELLGIITVQSVVRHFLCRKRVTLLSKRIHASIQIQTIWRGYDHKLRYGFVLVDIITVQSVIRRFLDARRANARFNGVLKIQSATRVWKAKRMVAIYQNAIVTIQSFMIKSLAVKHIACRRRELAELFDEGEVINYSTNQLRRRDDKVSLIRQAEKETECLIDEQILESVVEEEDVVSISTRSSSMSDDLDLASEIEHEVASVVIQMHWRRYFSSTNYTMTKKAVVTCQSFCRRWIAKNETQNLRVSRSKEVASIKITSFGRGCFTRIKYMKTLVAATTIQKIVRGYIAKKLVDEMKCFQMFLAWENNAKKIQAQFRRHICESMYNTVLAGVVSLQARIHSIHATKAVNDLMIARAKEEAATLIQKTYRSFYASSALLAQKQAASIIQSAFRRHILEQKYRSVKKASVLIQAKFRSKRMRELFLLHLKCVQILQRTGRNFLVKVKTKQLAATNIQRLWRGYSANVDFMLLVLATIKIQAAVRMRSAFTTYQNNLDGIVLMQACFRSKLARKTISSQHCSSVVMQKIGRGFLARIQKKEQLVSIAVIQRAAREMMARSHNEIKTFAATEIQRIWRGFSAHTDYMMQVMAAMRIQSSVRYFLRKKILQRMNKASVITAQENDLVADSALKETGDTKPLTYQTREIRLEILADSQMCMDSPPSVIDVIVYESNSKREVNNVSAIPKIIATSSYVATPNKIHVRSLSKYEKHTAKAIKVLRKSELFSDVMEAVSTLEKTTCKSIDSCKLLLKARAENNLLSLLSCCNRSSPHLELVRAILHTFTNISGHQASLSLLVTRESSVIMMDVVQMFRDKADIFALSTALLETFVRSVAFILSEYSSHEHQKCMRGILSLSRKRASARSSPEFEKGVMCLEKVIRIFEGGAIESKPKKCPYCEREFA